MTEPVKTPAAPIPVTTQGGTTGYLPAEFADTAADIGGVRQATQAEMEGAQLRANDAATARQLQEQFSGIGGGIEGAVAPALAGAARGLSLGTSDEALLSAAEMLGGRAGREAVRKRLADYQTYAPISSTVGELGAIGAGAFAGEEAGLLEGPAAVSRLGRAIEGGAARFLGEGSALARVGGRALGGALSGAAEGAIYSAGKTASDAAIHDEPLTGEKLVAGATHGALFGGGLGGALGAAGGLVGEATRGLSGFRAPRAAAEGAEAAPRGSIADQLEKTADVKTIKALGGSAGDLRKLEDTVPGGYRRVAQDVRQDIEESTGKSIGLHNRESLHEYASKRVDELGDKLGVLLKKLDESGTGIAPSPARFAEQARQELIEPHLIMKTGGTSANDVSFSVMPGQEKPVAAVQKWLGRIDDAFSERAPTFGEWQKIRVGLDKEIYEGVTKASPKVDALRQLRGMMEKELETSGEAAAQSMNSTFRSEYQATKSLYQSVKKAEELTARGVSKELSNNSVGLRATMGLMAGVASGAPMTGLLLGAAGKVIQDRGDMLAADLLSRAASLGGAGRIANRVTSELNKGVGALIPTKTAAKEAAALTPPARAASSPLGIKSTGNQRKDYTAISSAIASAVANPNATSDRISKSLGDLGDHAPKTANSVISTTLNGLDYLASKLPPSRQDRFSLQPQFQKARASDAEISQFMRYAQAVNDPLIVLREAKSGTLTRDHVEAVKAVYPNLYAEMQTTVMRYVVDSKQELPYDKRIQLGILLDIPADKSLSPDFLRAVQATYSDAEKAGTESPSSQSVAPQIAGSVQTATQGAVERAE